MLTIHMTFIIITKYPSLLLNLMQSSWLCLFCSRLLSLKLWAVPWQCLCSVYRCTWTVHGGDCGLREVGSGTEQLVEQAVLCWASGCHATSQHQQRGKWVCGHTGLFCAGPTVKWCLMSSDVSWHIRDKLWPMPKHSSINLYVHGNQKAR